MRVLGHLLAIIASLCITLVHPICAEIGSLNREEVQFLNSKNICPIHALTLTVHEDGTLTPTAGGIDPIAAQWSGTLSGQNVTLTCRVKGQALPGSPPATGDVTITGDQQNDSLGGALGNDVRGQLSSNDVFGGVWRWTYDPESKLVSLTPQTESPFGYRFMMDFNTLKFTGLVTQEEISRTIQELYRMPDLGAGRDKKRATQSNGRRKPAKRAKIARTPAFPLVSQLPAGADARLSYYRNNASMFRKFHDQGRRDNRGLLKMLNRYGLRPPARRTRWAPSPFSVAVFSGKFRWPLDAGIVSSEFGRRWGRPHEGIDIAAALHEPVFAAGDGQVLYAGNGLRGYGNVIIVRHDRTTITLYAHNLSLLVHNEERVSSGQLIALLGSTGRSTGPHIHFEIRRAGRALNPRQLLPPTRF